jgi:hypothetical protein
MQTATGLRSQTGVLAILTLAKTRKSIEESGLDMITEAVLVKGVFMASLIATVGIGIVIERYDFSSDEVFLYSLLGGVIGTIVSLAVYGAADLRELSRHALANVGIAFLFGPPMALYISEVLGHELSIYTIVSVSGSLGIGGMFGLKTLGPVVLESVRASVGNVIESFFARRKDKE